MRQSYFSVKYRIPEIQPQKIDMLQRRVHAATAKERATGSVSGVPIPPCLAINLPCELTALLLVLLLVLEVEISH
jgi:hypothetical protein